jgi:hypothetical protein
MHERTGFLGSNEEEIAKYTLQLFRNVALAESFRQEGHKTVQKFAPKSFAKKFEQIARGVHPKPLIIEKTSSKRHRQ